MENGKIKELLAKIARDDSEKAFKRFYTLCYDRFFRVAFYFLKRDEWAQEVVLDVFFSFWNNRRQHHIFDNFLAYSFTLIKNASLNYLEKEQRRETYDIEASPETASPIASPEEELLNEELFNCYLDALDSLPDRCREVFLLIKEERLTYAQVAEQLNISVKTVDAQLQKATAKLRAHLSLYRKGV